MVQAKENEECNPEYFVQAEEEVDILSPTLIGVNADTVILQGNYTRGNKSPLRIAANVAPPVIGWDPLARAWRRQRN